MSTSLSTDRLTLPLEYTARSAVPVAGLVAAIAGSLANAVVAVVAVRLGADADGPLMPTAYVTLTVVAAFVGALGWHVVNRRARRPERTMRWLVPAVVVTSFVPDVGVASQLGWRVAGALMVMHVTTAAVAVTTYRRVLPLRASAPWVPDPGAATPRVDGAPA